MRPGSFWNLGSCCFFSSTSWMRHSWDKWTHTHQWRDICDFWIVINIWKKKKNSTWLNLKYYLAHTHTPVNNDNWASQICSETIKMYIHVSFQIMKRKLYCQVTFWVCPFERLFPFYANLILMCDVMNGQPKTLSRHLLYLQVMKEKCFRLWNSKTNFCRLNHKDKPTFEKVEFQVWVRARAEFRCVG